MPDTAAQGLRQPRRRRRSARWSVVSAAAATASMAACTAGGGSTPPISATASQVRPPAASERSNVPAFTTPTTGKVFTGSGLWFVYERSWTATTWTAVSTMTDSVVYLSSQPTSDPCSTTRDKAGQVVSTECGEPLHHLTPGSVLIDWYLANFPGTQITAEQGTVAVFGGHPSRLLVGAADDSCLQLGAHTSVDAAISYGPAEPGGQEAHMDACLVSPAAVPAVLSMLHSLRLSGPLR